MHQLQLACLDSSTRAQFAVQFTCVNLTVSRIFRGRRFLLTTSVHAGQCERLFLLGMFLNCLLEVTTLNSQPGKWTSPLVSA